MKYLKRQDAYRAGVVVKVWAGRTMTPAHRHILQEEKTLCAHVEVGYKMCIICFMSAPWCRLALHKLGSGLLA